MTTFPRLLRIDHVKDLTKMSKSTIYRKINSGEFPSPVDLGGKSKRWREDELIEWLESRPRTVEVSND